ncbi:Villin-4 [Frankliniella fusca]|uniref:Villin-4 n=1 Tax=Frankliniella fusca TaxID=407009 RepID=A0AAE1HQS6_9NEOP|nr:Villin-4 [Frankliniella fusca]
MTVLLTPRRSGALLRTLAQDRLTHDNIMRVNAAPPSHRVPDHSAFRQIVAPAKRQLPPPADKKCITISSPTTAPRTWTSALEDHRASD